MYGYFTHQLQIFKPSYPHNCTGLTVRFSIQKHQTNYSSHKLELPVFINLRKYSKFNPYSSFYLKTKTKKKKICLFPYICTEVQPCTSLFQNQNLNKILEITLNTLTFDWDGHFFNKKLKLIWISIF